MIKRFMQYVIDNPIDFDVQESVARDGSKWSSDMWTVEMCRLMIMGESEFKSRPSMYLDGNVIASKNDVINLLEVKTKNMQLLQEHKDFSDNILLCEVGRGIDIILVNQIKSWKKISVYDCNDYVVAQLRNHFSDVIITQENTQKKDFSIIKEPTILLAQRTQIQSWQREVMKLNKNLMCIIDGKIVGE